MSGKKEKISIFSSEGVFHDKWSCVIWLIFGFETILFEMNMNIDKVILFTR